MPIKASQSLPGQNGMNTGAFFILFMMLANSAKANVKNDFQEHYEPGLDVIIMGFGLCLFMCVCLCLGGTGIYLQAHGGIFKSLETCYGGKNNSYDSIGDDEESCFCYCGR